MKKITLPLLSITIVAACAAAQTPEVKFIAETLVVQAEGTYAADPDLATLTFDISSQEKELKPAYDGATKSMQRIVALAEHSGLKKEDVSTGVLTVSPFYQGDRKKRARSFLVSGHIVLKVHDFALIGPLLDGSVDEGIADFRSLTYSLENEETAKQRAVGEAMQRAMGRASAALAAKGQKIGTLRFASVDVTRLEGVPLFMPAPGLTLSAEVAAGQEYDGRRKSANLSPPVPPMAPEKITVRASVQCAFQIL